MAVPLTILLLSEIRYLSGYPVSRTAPLVALTNRCYWRKCRPNVTRTMHELDATLTSQILGAECIYRMIDLKSVLSFVIMQ